MSILNEVKGVLGMVAPTLGTALGGPLGGMAASVLAKRLGLPEATPEAVADALAKDQSPETLLLLKEAENDFLIRLEELGLERERLDVQRDTIEADDRANARARQIALKDRAPAVLAGVLLCGFFGSLAALIGLPVPDENQPLVFSMVGSLGTMAGLAVTFYFGTSRGSKDKAVALEAALETAMGPRPPGRPADPNAAATSHIRN